MKRLTFRALALRQSNLQYSPTDATPQFLCGISHTLSRPAKFISLFIYLSTREKCLPRGFYLAFSEPRRLDSNSCFFTVDCAAAISVPSCWVLENLYGISFLFPGDFCFQGEDKSFSIFTGSLRALTFQFCCESFTVKLSRKAITFVYLVCVLSFIIWGVCFVIFPGVYNIRFFSRKPTRWNAAFAQCRLHRSFYAFTIQHLSAWTFGAGCVGLKGVTVLSQANICRLEYICAGCTSKSLRVSQCVSRVSQSVTNWKKLLFALNCQECYLC